MSKKNKCPPSKLKIEWTVDETNPDGREPSDTLMMRLAQDLGRMAARREIAEQERQRLELVERFRDDGVSDTMVRSDKK